MTLKDVMERRDRVAAAIKADETCSPQMRRKRLQSLDNLVDASFRLGVEAARAHIETSSPSDGDSPLVAKLLGESD